MSTSPSWFDQEKLNRLVKKVGPKKQLSEPAAATPAPSSSQPLPPAPTHSPLLSPAKPSESQALPPKSDSQRLPETKPSDSQALPPKPSDSQSLPKASDSQRLPDAPPTDEVAASEQSIASTSRISLVSKPTSTLSEHRSLPALPRRTTPLPGLKSLFQNSPQEAGVPPTVEMPSVITQPLPEPIRAPESKPEKEKTDFGPIDEETGFPRLTDPLAAGDDDLAGIWQKMALLNEELAQTIQERDHALGDINQMREQLRVSDELLAKQNAGPSDDLAQVARERDNALAELKALKEKPAQRASQEIKLPDGVTKTKELVFLTQERDQARKEYSELRRQFEGLKREQVPSGPPPLPRDDVAKVRKELEQQLDGFRLQLEEKKKEIAALKAAPAPPPLPASFGTPIEPDDKLKAEIAELKAQVAKFKEDASIAQRGLALSQKALQETRETLRDATEGTSLSRHNFDNLKNECASLTQQNTVLQAQNEQLSRELAAAKQRQSGRIGM
jgi:hypothetical protein